MVRRRVPVATMSVVLAAVLSVGCADASGPVTSDGPGAGGGVAISDDGSGMLLIDGARHSFERFACGERPDGASQWSAQAPSGADSTVWEVGGTYAVEVRVPLGGDPSFEVWEGSADPAEGEIDVGDGEVVVRMEVTKVHDGTDELDDGPKAALGLELTC